MKPGQKEKKTEQYYVADRTVFGDKITEWTNKRSFEEFLFERNPALLKRYKSNYKK